MKLWFVEISVRDLLAAESWYTRFFGLEPQLRDARTGFLLYELSEGRVAIRPGTRGAGGTLVHLACDDLTAESARLHLVGIDPVRDTKVSNRERYRREVYEDGEGNGWVVFEWME